MAVQYVGNQQCHADYAMQRAQAQAGLFEHYYDPKPADGGAAGMRTRRVG
jgi:hypothetical protein